MTFDRHRGSQGYVPGSQGHAPGSQGGGVGGGYSGHDGYAIGAGFAELAKLVDEAKRLSFLGAQGGGWPGPVDRIAFRPRGGETIPVAEADLGLPGPHQSVNAATALACLEHWRGPPVPVEAKRRGLRRAVWPGRLQRLERPRGVPPAWEVWLDCAANPAAAALAIVLRRWLQGDNCRAGPVLAIFGCLERQPPGPVLALLDTCVTALRAVPVPEQACHSPAKLARLAQAAGTPARAAPDVESALRSLATGFSASEKARVIVTGSLYLVRAVRAGAWAGLWRETDAAD